MNVMTSAVNNVNRSSHNIESALRVLDGVNSNAALPAERPGKRRSGAHEGAPIASPPRAVGSSDPAEEVLKIPASGRNQEIAADMLADAQAYAKGNEKLISLAKEDKGEEMESADPRRRAQDTAAVDRGRRSLPQGQEETRNRA